MAEISKTADQALAVLLEMTESGPMTAAELSRSLNLNRTVVARLLTTLHRRGFVSRQNDRYTVGALLVRIAARVDPDLRAAATKVMTELADEIGETVVLHVPDGPEAVVLEQVVGVKHVVRVEHRIGSRHSLSQAASGRVLLAYLDESVLKRVLATTGEDPVALGEQLESIRQAGHAVSHDELQHGVFGIAVPVRNGEYAIASLAVLIPATRAVQIGLHLPKLLEAAGKVAESMPVQPRAGAAALRPA